MTEIQVIEDEYGCFKTCTRCLETKSAECFSVQQSKCKQCRASAQKKIRRQMATNECVSPDCSGEAQPGSKNCNGCKFETSAGTYPCPFCGIAYSGDHGTPTGVAGNGCVGASNADPVMISQAVNAVYDPERPSPLTPGEAISIAESMLGDEYRYEIRDSLERFVFAARCGYLPSEKWQKNCIGKVLRVTEPASKKSDYDLVG